MTEALRILSEVKAAGGTVELMPPDGLRVSGPRALVEQVKAHKPDIILALLASPVPTPAFDHEAFDERAGIIEANGVPREWAEGFAVLCTMPCPAAYAPERWRQIVDDGGLFLDKPNEWARKAAGLGWRAVDVFGVSPDAPERRFDGMGLVPLLQGRAVVAITADSARIKQGGTFYRQNLSVASVALWKLGGVSNV
jgi:hypothetical protein